jgi:DNA-binding transcriptional LysR family regulator
VRVADEPMVAVSAAGHPLGRARRASVRALAGERWIAFPSRTCSAPEPYASALAQALAGWRLAATDIVPIDSLTAQKRMVEAGFGLALLPKSAVHEELRTGTLVALRVPGPGHASGELIRRRNAYLSGAARALLALLTAPPRRRRRRA